MEKNEDRKRERKGEMTKKKELNEIETNQM